MTNLNITTYNPLDLATYNPGCYDELSKFAESCTQFKADVINQIGLRFKITIIILVTLIILYMYIKYGKPKFSTTEFYIKYLAFRLDFIIMLITLITITFMFL
jgi:hypothetical protein